MIKTSSLPGPAPKPALKSAITPALSWNPLPLDPDPDLDLDLDLNLDLDLDLDLDLNLDPAVLSKAPRHPAWTTG